MISCCSVLDICASGPTHHIVPFLLHGHRALLSSSAARHIRRKDLDQPGRQTEDLNVNRASVTEVDFRNRLRRTSRAKCCDREESRKQPQERTIQAEYKEGHERADSTELLLL